VIGTIEGTAELLKDRSAHQVRDEVMTPGGTTAAAFVAMERSGFTGAVYDGVSAAARQSKELGS
jgi:pyrroline-5-carboxylate reductase